MENKYCEIDSNEFQAMIAKCQKQKGSSNFLSLCCICWSFLSNYQKNNHKSDHEDAIKTPIQYNTKEQLMILAKEYNKTKTIDGKIMIEILLNKPLGVFKEKKGKKKKQKK